MLEPLTKITIPDENARLRESRGLGSAERQIIILNEVYDNAPCQENLALVASRFIEQGGFRLITVEGDEKQLKKEEHEHLQKSKVRDIVASGTYVSAGVRHLLATSDLEFEVWGVDSLALNNVQTAAMTELLAMAKSREEVFGRFRQQLEKIRRKSYTPEMRKLGQILFPFYQTQTQLWEQVTFLQQLGQQAGLEMEAYAAISGFIEVLNLEKGLDEQLISKQREELVSLLVERALGWWTFTPPNLVSFDMKKAEPVIAFWVKKTGRTEEGLEDEIGTRGIEAVFLECKEWIEKWLIGSALDVRMGRRSGHDLYEDWLLFALRLDIDVFRFRELREYVYMLRKTATIMTDNVDEEIKGCAERLLDSLCVNPQQQKLAEIERKIDFLYRAYRLELSQAHLEQFDVTDNSLLSLQRELGDIIEKPQLDLGVTEQLETARDKVFDFYKLSRERGLTMLEKTLELMRGKDKDRAILVCGGFHKQTITAHLKARHADIAWSVIDPTPVL